MADLTNRYIYETYPSVVGIGAQGSEGLTNSLKPLTDGVGDEMPIEVSRTEVNITAANTTTVQLNIAGYGEVIDSNGNWLGGGGGIGAQGAQGATGAQGAIGAKGNTGAQGNAGTNGAQGAQGAIGAQGIAGAKGNTGAQGTAGVNGAQGAVGAQGNAGTNGAQGAQGIAGAQGATGTGAQGAQGDAGPTGAQGNPGATGAQGSAAPAGLINGTGTNSLISAPGLTTNPALAGNDSISLGNGANASNPNSIAIGKVSNTNVGADPYVAIVPDGVDITFREKSVVIGTSSYPSYEGVAIGYDARHTGGGYYKTVVIGNTMRTQGSNDIAIGYNSNTLGNAANKIIIGTNNNNYAEESIQIGNDLGNSDDSRVQSIMIGSGIRSAQRGIAIGNDCPNFIGRNSIQIGNDCPNMNANESVSIGYKNNLLSYASGQVVIGEENSSAAQRNVIIGTLNVGGTQDGTIMIGESNTCNGGRAHGIGYQTITTGTGEDKMAYGTLTKATADRAVAIGRGAEATHANSVALGTTVVSKSADTAHVQNLNVNTVLEYADNAAAVAASLPIGQIYRTGDLLKIVHA